MTRIHRTTLLTGAAFFALLAIPAQAQVAPTPARPAEIASPAVDEPVTAQDETAALDEIVVVGSRGKPRTDVERPVPVDVVGATELLATGQTDLGQQLQFTSPSFNSTKFGVNGATNFADPASLRGMSPDQVLLLVNGHRRHQFSGLNLNVSPGLGTVVSDLNSIPSGAVDRIEVLRDGAAAQYGSDAIAGIVNIQLRRNSSGGFVSATTGVNKEGDGFTRKLSFNHGVPLGSDGGFLNYTLEYFATDPTNRSDPYNGVLYPATPANYGTTGPTPNFPYATANPRADRGVYPAGPFVVGTYGSNDNETKQAFINSELPIGADATLYLFGGYSRKDIVAAGFFRAPATVANSALSIFPDGYVPELPGQAIDYSVNTGVKTILAGWDVDLSYSFGHNHLDQWANNTVNASLGAASPTEFYVGRTEFEQQIVDATASRDFGAVAFLQNLNAAVGAQWREDRFAVTRGSPESYAIGPLAVTGKASGSNGRPGYAPADEIDTTRTNLAAFVDVEADVSDAILIAAALRYEDYSDFGGAVSGKLAGRYKFNDEISIRGSYNRGFRAPSLAQIGNRVTTSTVQNNLILQTQQVSSDDPRLKILGIPDPVAEVSDSFNIGVTGEYPDVLGGRISFTVDAFNIDIENRIAITDGILTANYPAVAALFPGVREIRFFTNQIDTQTRGIDAVITYRTSIGSDDISLTLAGTNASTEVVDQRATPGGLVVGASAANQSRLLVGETAIELIEVAQPRVKILLSGTYTHGALTFGFNATHFGEVEANSTGLSAADGNVRCDAANRCVQVFAAHQLVDLNLTYAFPNGFTLTAGANNVFDVYPDKWNNTTDGAVGEASSYSNGQTPYTRNAGQFGFNGSYYYLTGRWAF
ncbi:TonB-dependent receptor [soil metagenome]